MASHSMGPSDSPAEALSFATTTPPTSSPDDRPGSSSDSADSSDGQKSRKRSRTDAYKGSRYSGSNSGSSSSNSSNNASGLAGYSAPLEALPLAFLAARSAPPAAVSGPLSISSPAALAAATASSSATPSSSLPSSPSSTPASCSSPIAGPANRIRNDDEDNDDITMAESLQVGPAPGHADAPLSFSSASTDDVEMAEVGPASGTAPPAGPGGKLTGADAVQDVGQDFVEQIGQGGGHVGQAVGQDSAAAPTAAQPSSAEPNAVPPSASHATEADTTSSGPATLAALAPPHAPPHAPLAPQDTTASSSVNGILMPHYAHGLAGPHMLANNAPSLAAAHPHVSSSVHYTPALLHFSAPPAMNATGSLVYSWVTLPPPTSSGHGPTMHHSHLVATTVNLAAVNTLPSASTIPTPLAALTAAAASIPPATLITSTVLAVPTASSDSAVAILAAIQAPAAASLLAAGAGANGSTETNGHGGVPETSAVAPPPSVQPSHAHMDYVSPPVSTSSPASDSPALPPFQITEPMFAPGPVFMPTHQSLAAMNADVKQFLIRWLVHPQTQHRPSETGIRIQMAKNLSSVRYQDLYGDQCDFQGIDWAAMGVTRRQAREQRTKTFQNYVSIKESDKWAKTHRSCMPWTCESYFRFRRMHMKFPMHLAHFQLRNLVASTSRTHVYFGDHSGTVARMDMLTGRRSVALKFVEHPDVQITTMAADRNVLVAGGFGGEYGIADLMSEYVGAYGGSLRAEGMITSDSNGISNHVEIHSLRSAGGPLAAFASNDKVLRIMDLMTEQMLCAMQFHFPVNCTAISPDRRLRVVVGDALKAYIIAAEPERTTALARGTGATRLPEYLQCLDGHRDYGFACAWAPDGYTLATGNQDRAIKIWDARKWCNAQGESLPVATLQTQQAGARSLRFSPAGSGKRLLVAGEEADYVDVIDAQTFRTQQTIDLFGEIGGIALTDDGQDLVVACSDYTRGGLLHFERCDAEAGLANFDEGHDYAFPELRRIGNMGLDWLGTEAPRRERFRESRRRLRTAAASGMQPF